MRNALGFILSIAVLACKSEPPKYQKSAAVQTLHAGQYVIREEGTPSPYSSERYVLSPDGSAEWHVLKKRGRYGDFYLDRIQRGQWEGLEGSITVRFEGGAEKRIETFDSIQVLPTGEGAETLDTLWLNRSTPGRSLKRIAAFR